MITTITDNKTWQLRFKFDGFIIIQKWTKSKNTHKDTMEITREAFHKATSNIGNIGKDTCVSL